MSKDLQYLLEQAKRHQMTKEEHEAQVRSFAYGNTHFENETITRDTIDEAIDTLKMSEAVYEV